MPDSNVSKAIILAAGRGTRMGDMTREIPKPMLPIHGRPMLDHILERLSSAGITRFLIVIGYHGEVIAEHLKESSRAVTLVRQDPVNGTGSGALLGKNFAGSEPFLLTYGDILCEPNEYVRAINILVHDPEVAAAVAVKTVDDPWQGAAVYEENGRISRMVEKPPRGTSTTHWNSAGFYIFRPVLFDYLARLQPSPRGEYELTSALDSMLTDGLELCISAVAGAWRDVGRPEDLAAVNASDPPL